MKGDPISGHTVRFTFTDGPMAKKTFEHIFDTSGTVTFRMLGGDGSSSAGKSATGGESKNAPEPKYELAMLRDNVWAVSYLGSGGYTLTTVLDFKTRKLLAFSSNEKGVAVQHGTFEYGERAPARAPSEHAHGERHA
jgi:hypothetical protein